MSIRIGCPLCHSTLDVSDDMAGQHVPCRTCNVTLQIPAPSPTTVQEQSFMERGPGTGPSNTSNAAFWWITTGAGAFGLLLVAVVLIIVLNSGGDDTTGPENI